MADADTVITRLDETVAAFDEAQTRLVDTIKQVQELRTGLFAAGDAAAGWSATDVVGQLQAARQHSMGLVWTLKGCAAAVRRNASGKTPTPLPDERTGGRGNLTVRAVVGASVAVFAITAMVLDLLDKTWISDRLYWAVLGVAAVIYVGAVALGTARERRFVLFALAGLGAGFISRDVAAKATGWQSDDWRSAATATALLLVAVITVEILRRRRR